MKKTQLQLANEHELKQLQQKFEKLRRIVTAEGFCKEWFKLLPKFKNRREAFEHLNDFYYNNVEPPTYRYSSYKNFLTYVYRQNK